jgi:hypothetical protein
MGTLTHTEFDRILLVALAAAEISLIQLKCDARLKFMSVHQQRRRKNQPNAVIQFGNSPIDDRQSGQDQVHQSVYVALLRKVERQRALAMITGHLQVVHNVLEQR